MTASRASRKVDRSDGLLTNQNIGEGKYTGLAAREAWLREAAELYMTATEIEGVPNSFDMKPGLVYMTRGLLRAAWDNVLGPDTRDRSMFSQAHKSDHWVNKFSNDGRLLTAGRNNYMLSKETCQRLRLATVWVEFETREAAADLDNYATQRKGQWAAIQETLHDHDLFDRFYVDEYAKDFGIETHKGTLTDQKIKQWVKSGFCYKVARGLYRIAKWDVSDLAPMSTMTFDYWQYEIIRRFADEQFRTPTATFGVGDIMTLFKAAEYDAYCTGKREFLRNDRNYISTRLAAAKFDRPEDYDPAAPVIPAYIPDGTTFPFLWNGRGTYQINPRVIHSWFRFDLRNDVKTLAGKVLDYIMHHSAAAEPFWIIKEDIPFILGGHASSVDKIIQYLFKMEMIEIDGDANSPAFAAEDNRPSWHQKAPMYFPSMPAFKAYNMKLEDEWGTSKWGDGRPIRLWLPWGTDPDYIESISHIERGYTLAKEMRASTGVIMVDRNENEIASAE